jgi:uncharacterized membrane protein YccC
VSFAFARKFWQFDSSLISKRTALRDAVAVAAALALGLAAGGPTIAVIMAIGAIATAMADGPEAVRVRLVRLLVAACAAALSAFAGAVTGGYPWLAVPTLAAWAFVCGFVVVLGADATTVGLNSLVVFIVLEHSALDPFRAASLAALVFGGGLVTIIASALALPSRVSPPQRAIAAAYAHLADIAAAPPHGHAMPPVSVPLAQAKHALQFFGSQHEVRGEALRTLLDQAERLRIEILSLEEWRDVELDRHDPTAPPVTTALAAVASALRGVSSALLMRSAATDEIAAACAAIERERERIAERQGAGDTDPLPPAIVRVLDAVMGQLRAADAAVRDTVTGFDLMREVTGALHVPLPPVRATFASLRANLTFDSTAFRHALRLAACVTVAETIVHLAHLSRGYWLPMTAALVLKPDFGETYARGVMRVVGTLLGILVAFGLHAAGIATNDGRIAIIFLAVFAARSFGRPNYAVLTLSITIYVVELLAISGESIDRTIGERTLNTLLGGGLALAFYAIWPTWERGKLRVVLADLIAAYRAYWNAVIARMARPRPRADDSEEAVLHDARIASRVARTNAQASLERARAEPARSIAELDLFAGILAAAHRFVLSTLRLETAAETEATLPQAVAAYAADVDRTLAAIDETLRGAELPGDLPDLREAHRALARSADDDASRFFAFEADNVANSLDTIVELLRRDARASTRRTRALNIKRLRRIARSS